MIVSPQRKARSGYDIRCLVGFAQALTWMNLTDVKHPLAIARINECEGVSGLHLVEERGLDGNCRLLHVDLMDARHQPHTGEFGHMSDCIAGRPPLDDGRSGCNRTGAELRTGEVKRN